jgi:hypothetical protein
MSILKKLVLLLVALAPFAMVFYGFSLALQMQQMKTLVEFQQVFRPTLLFGLLGFTAIVVFLVLLAQNDHIAGARKVLWVLFMVYLAPVALPVFWFTYIRGS